MARLKFVSPPVLALVLFAMLLMAAIAVEIDQGMRFRQSVLKIRQEKPAPFRAALRPEYVLPPEESFPETLARPLFVATRRASSVSGAGPQAMKKGQFVLTGVTLLPKQRMALLRDVASSKTERVEEGKEVRGMVVEKVDQDKVTLKQGEEREELVLRVLPSQTAKQGSANQSVQEPAPSAPAPLAPPGTPASQPPLQGQAPSAPNVPNVQAVRPKMTPEQMQDLNRRRAERGLPPMMF